MENTEVEQVEPVQMNIYQSNTYTKNLSWLRFDNEPWVQERQQDKGPTVLPKCLCCLSNISK